MSDTSADEPNHLGTDRERKKHRRRGLKYTFAVISVVVVVAFTAAGVEYYRLQPRHHFANVSVISTPSPSSGVAGPYVATTPPQGKPGGANMAHGTGAAQSTADTTGGTFNVLLLGSDERTNGTPGHSDSIIMIHVDLPNHLYNVLSIPRDSRIFLKGFGYTKLTSVMYVEQAKYGMKEGTKSALNAISNLTGLSINYYAETNYWGFQNIVDAVGGITMHIPFPVTLTHAWYPEDQGKTFTPGDYTIDGKMVTEVVHERYSLSNGDYGRQQLQESALVGIAKKILANPTLAVKAFQEMGSYLIETNMSPEDMVSLVLAIKDFQMSQLHYYQATGQEVLIYDDVLQAKDDEILLNTDELKQIVQQHFH